ncbi:MAG: hypothetical protein ABR573_01825 [Candidatus Dormibacteria bacterium]
MGASTRAHRVVVEATTRRAFATALDWPGWSRGGRNEDAAVAALIASVPRFALVSSAAGQMFNAAAGIEIVDRIAGSTYTDFGVPGAELASDRDPLGEAEVSRSLALLEASWKAYDRARASGAAELRKGPRGGGRDRDKIDAHVLEAERNYASAVGAKLHEVTSRDQAALDGHRQSFIAALRDAGARPAPPAGVKPKRWTFRYAVRRATWHALDHAWEIEDRS